MNLNAPFKEMHMHRLYLLVETATRTYSFKLNRQQQLQQQLRAVFLSLLPVTAAAADVNGAIDTRMRCSGR